MPDIVTSKIFVDGEKGITAAKMNQIISGAVIQPSFVSSKPASSTLDPTDQILELKGAGSYATITGQQLIDSVSASVTQNITPTIWSVRLRSLNTLGNSTMECDQRNAGTTLVNPASGFIIDRWGYAGAGSFTANFGQQNANLPDLCVPGTSYRITRAFFRVTLTGQMATPAAGSYLQLNQAIEGSNWRELSNDVHSLQVLVRSSVSGLKFGIALNDPTPVTKSLTKLATIPSANTWTLLPFNNLPVWPSGNFSPMPGNVGYYLTITLMSGGTYIAPANDTWQTGNFFGATGQDNFCANPLNSTFDIGFIQHEPGSQCSTPMDLDFNTNLSQCQRYYTKSYDHGVKPGAVNSDGIILFINPTSSTQIWHSMIFKRTMAKVPLIMRFYSSATGAANAIRNISLATDISAGAGGIYLGDASCGGLNVTAAPAAGSALGWHYVADTGW
jgi:hypothetical protein